MNKQELFPDVDHIDVQVRPETLRSRGEPVILQLPLVPCYALTIHKTQSLSVKHIVRGCLEGVFAFGQVYVLVSLPMGRWIFLTARRVRVGVWVVWRVDPLRSLHKPAEIRVGRGAAEGHLERVDCSTEPCSAEQ